MNISLLHTTAIKTFIALLFKLKAMQNTALPHISQVISESLPANVDFKPKRDFYTIIGINKHRFSKILKGEIDPTRSELISIASYFNIPVVKFL